MDKNEIDNVEARNLATMLLEKFGLEASLDVLKEMENEGLITEYERVCVSEILKDIDAQNCIRRTFSITSPSKEE